VAVEAEKTLGFAGVHQLLVPLLPAVDRLPEPQGRALGVAFGLVTGPAADPFLVGLAALTLLSDAAEDRPVLCVIDDAQWLDEESAGILSFVARRLLAERVGMLFAIRESAEPDPRLQALPDLRITGLPAQETYQLLETSTDGPIDAAVAARIFAETGGNPLAAVETARELTSEQRDGRVPLLEPLPVGRRVEALFMRRVRELPPDTQALLLLAAANDPGRGSILWQAAAAEGIPEHAALPAEAAGLATFWPNVQFAHPLVRSAIYHAATSIRRRQVHRALAAACDPVLDADTRALHLAAAVAGPDEEVAAEQQAAAERAGNRGGSAAAAALLERAALLTPDPARRAERRLSAVKAHLLAGAVDRADALLAEATPGLRDSRSAAVAAQLKGRIFFARGQAADSASAHLDAAQRLRPVDPRGARNALLSALHATVFAGWAPSSALLQEIARIARSLPAIGDAHDSGTDLLLQGYADRVTRGYAGAAPTLRRGLQALISETSPDVSLQRLELAAITAADLMDDEAVDRLTERWIARARERHAFASLAGALAFRSALLEGAGGPLAATRAAEQQARELAEVTRNHGGVPPIGAQSLLTIAMSGRDAAFARELPSRGVAGERAMAEFCLGVLEISLGNYAPAVRCLEPAFADDTPLVATEALPELVEAAVRAGSVEIAGRALERLAERASATDAPLALGLLARSRALMATPDDAREHYEEALDRLGSTRAAPPLARAHLLYGEWLRRQRHRREARDQLRTAHDMFDALGMDAFAERAGAELRATGERAQKRDAGFPEELTPQEAHVADLVSRGEANRDIAAQLFISPSTVEYHLRKVFRKLGVSSRTQLARRILDDGAVVLSSQ
jgi:DNA-binding CsgD family transcriptional regulator